MTSRYPVSEQERASDRRFERKMEARGWPVRIVYGTLITPPALDPEPTFLDAPNGGIKARIPNKWDDYQAAYKAARAAERRVYCRNWYREHRDRWPGYEARCKARKAEREAVA